MVLNAFWFKRSVIIILSILSSFIVCAIVKSSCGYLNHANPNPSAPSVIAMSNVFSKLSNVECSDKHIMLKHV